MPERRPPPPEQGSQPEKERQPYHRAAQFPGEQLAGKAYFHAQALIYETPCELSAYRFHVNYVWFVAVLGLAPPVEVDQKIQGILADGTPVTLPSSVLTTLFDRRAQETQKGPWVKYHHRTGKKRKK